MQLYEASHERAETKDLVDALLGASRALVRVAARSLAAWDVTVTLNQYRVLVLLCARGDLRSTEVAEVLGVTPPSGTRICDRLAQKGLVRRSRSPRDRRTVKISVTHEGRDLVDQVSSTRRVELGQIVEQMPDLSQRAFVDSLRAFSTAAGEVEEQEWALGWGQ